MNILLVGKFKKKNDTLQSAIKDAMLRIKRLAFYATLLLLEKKE